MKLLEFPDFEREKSFSVPKFWAWPWCVALWHGGDSPPPLPLRPSGQTDRGRTGKAGGDGHALVHSSTGSSKRPKDVVG